MKTHGFFNFLLMVVGLTFFVSVSGAAHTPIKAPMGTWKADASGKKHFEDAKVIPGYNYYYIGSINQPDSVMALSNKYKLHESKHWALVSDPTDRILRGWVQGWKNDGHSAADMSGGSIIDPKGNAAGFWYSHYDEGAVRMLDNGELEVFQPHPAVGPARPGQGG